MGCNCKAQNDFKKLVNRYGEETYYYDNNSFKKIILNIFKFLMGIISGILISLLFIVMAVPMIIYVVICIVIGIEPTVKIPWLKKQKTLEKKLKKDNEGN